jgi:hypothetical protein
VLEPSIDFMRLAQHHSSLHAGKDGRQLTADSEGNRCSPLQQTLTGPEGNSQPTVHQEACPCTSCAPGSMHLYLLCSHAYVCLLHLLITTDLPLLWPERWGWGDTWRGPLIGWDTFQSEAVAWVESVAIRNPSPAFVMSTKDLGGLLEVPDLYAPLIKSLLYPLCCLSYTGVFGCELASAVKPPPLPAAGGCLRTKVLNVEIDWNPGITGSIIQDSYDIQVTNQMITWTIVQHPPPCFKCRLLIHLQHPTSIACVCCRSRDAQHQ